MISQTWAIVVTGSVVALLALIVLWLRMPVHRWYCRRCKKISSAGRFHPGKCGCGSTVLVSYFCNDCKSWNTTPTPGWHCVACHSKQVVLGVEYNLGTAIWRWRNRPT